MTNETTWTESLFDIASIVSSVTAIVLFVSGRLVEGMLWLFLAWLTGKMTEGQP